MMSQGPGPALGWGQHFQPGGRLGSLLGSTIFPSSAHNWNHGLKMNPPLGSGGSQPCWAIHVLGGCQGGVADTTGSLGVGQELWQPCVSKSAQFLHFCINPSPLGKVFTPSPEGNSAGWERQTVRTGREPHPQSLSHIQPWPCQQFMWEKCGVGQKNQEQFICTGS